MKQCENGHFFDEARFSECPYCRQRPAVRSLPPQPTPQKQAGRTVMPSEEPEIGKTAPLAGAPAAAEIGKTVPLAGAPAASVTNAARDPVVGFLVCVEGPHRGEAFSLRMGRNWIGRGAEMQVALVRDEAVSREHHAGVTYDEKGNAFRLLPGVARGLVYQNGRQVETDVPLAAYDSIQVGNSRLLFLPLCGERFQWAAQ